MAPINIGLMNRLYAQKEVLEVGIKVAPHLQKLFSEPNIEGEMFKILEMYLEKCLIVGEAGSDI